MLLSRLEINDLSKWSRQRNRKPLIIRGARQVGKSTLARQLAEETELELLEVNFERNPQYRQAFVSNEPKRILTALQLLTGKSVAAEGLLLFLDEIQAAPEALAALRYLYEEMPQLHVVAAGSLLEFTLGDARFPMPVGRIEYMHLGPLRFEDFLRAMQEPALAELLENCTLEELRAGAIAPPVHDKYMELLRQYWIVGGLPEAAANYAANREFSAVSRVHQSIVATYRDDFSKYSHGALKERVQLVFDRLPLMVGRKFKYVRVSQEHRAAELAAALQQLCMARVAYKVRHTAANGVPLEAEVNERHFKTLYMDVGLLAGALKLSLLDLHKEDLSLVNDGALAEQFVGQHLLYSGAWYEPPVLHYWMREAKNAAAEVDYVIAHGQQVIPIEIKAGSTGTLRSLHRFLQEKKRSLALRFNGDLPSVHDGSITALDGTRFDYRLISLPLYLIGQARRLQ
jgi:uncharacterized protein